MLSISRLTAPLEGCRNTNRGLNFTHKTPYKGRNKKIQIYISLSLKSRNGPEVKPATRLRTEPDFVQTDIVTWVSLWQRTKLPGRHVSTVQRETATHYNTAVALHTFHHHKEPCTHFSCFQNKQEFWPVADGEQRDTLAEITQHKRFDNKTEERRSQESVHLSFLSLVCVNTFRSNN